MTDLPQECEVADCLRPVHARGKHCAAHAKQHQRGGITHAPVRDRLPLRERIGHLCDELANADSDDDAGYARAWDRLRKAIEEWAHALRQSRAGRARMQSMSPAEQTAFRRQGAKARSRKLGSARRIKIASNAARSRWDACKPGKQACEPSPPPPTPGTRRAPERG